jgi:hypothetical protein
MVLDVGPQECQHCFATVVTGCACPPIRAEFKRLTALKPVSVSEYHSTTMILTAAHPACHSETDTEFPAVGWYLSDFTRCLARTAKHLVPHITLSGNALVNEPEQSPSRSWFLTEP